ncbi:MAG: type II and III secretion system family protein [Pseudobdellovibrionaceae bacterium]
MTAKKIGLKNSLTSLVALTALLPVSACDLANNYTKIDRSTNSEFQDFRDAMAPREAGLSDKDVSASIPELESYVLDESQNAKPMPLVSLSINQSIPLREALFELAKQSDYDIELDPRIAGSIIFTARNKPLDDVIDRICEISGLRYKVQDDTLRIELDTPYTKNYKIDYLTFVRKNTSSMKTDVSVDSGDSGAASGGSSFSVETQSEVNFWADLDANLKQILASNTSSGYLKTNSDPQISLTAANPVTPPAPPVNASALGEVAPNAGMESDFISAPQLVDTGAAMAGAGALEGQSAQVNIDTSATAQTEVPASAQGGVQDQAVQPAVSGVQAIGGSGSAAAPAPQQPVLRVESLPASAGSSNEVTFTPAYSINKSAGVISVYGNERLQKQISSYLEIVKKAATSQVLIEAKVLEVDLTDEFSQGINWSLLDGGVFQLSGGFGAPGMEALSATGLGGTFGVVTKDISSVVTALSRFGTVHALASPRLTVINNQSAILNVSRRQVYFELDVTYTAGTADTPPQTTVDSTIKTVPEGVLINVMPSINLDTNQISMSVRPTVTNIVDRVDDPGVTYIVAVNDLDADVLNSQIPVLNVQEMESVINMDTGKIMVMGGLLQDKSSSTQEALPGASEVPVFGGLFRNQGDKISKTELVVFMKATILENPGDSLHQTDRELYKVFGQDRRPEKM